VSAIFCTLSDTRKSESGPTFEELWDDVSELRRANDEDQPYRHVTQRTPLWDAVRKKQLSLTATELASAVGLGYDSPYRLWEYKTGRRRRQWTGFQQTLLDHGTNMEPFALLFLERYLNCGVLECGVWRVPHHPWLGGSPDGLLMSRPRCGIEVKCPARARIADALRPGHVIQSLVYACAFGVRYYLLFYYIQQEGDRFSTPQTRLYLLDAEEHEGSWQYLVKRGRRFVGMVEYNLEPPRRNPKPAAADLKLLVRRVLAVLPPLASVGLRVPEDLVLEQEPTVVR
jgi:hypothetical protein